MRNAHELWPIFKPNDKIRFTRPVPHTLHPIQKGDEAEYMGAGIALMLSGHAKGWVIALEEYAPVEKLP